MTVAEEVPLLDLLDWEDIEARNVDPDRLYFAVANVVVDPSKTTSLLEPTEIVCPPVRVATVPTPKVISPTTIAPFEPTATVTPLMTCVAAL